MGTLHDARHCGAKKHQGEGTCTQAAGWGTKHPGYGPCKLHGGSSPSVNKMVVEAQARELFGKIAPEVRPVDNPLAAYSQFAGRVMAWMDLMDELIGDLKTVGYQADAGEQVRAAVQLYERAMDRANTVLSSYARLKIDERLAAITEAQKQAVIRAINAALDEAGLQGDARADATKAAARHLRAA